MNVLAAATDPDPDVRGALAASTVTLPDEVYVSLALDTSPSVRAALAASRRRVPAAAAEVLLSDPTGQWNLAGGRGPLPEGVVRFLATQTDATTRARLLQSPRPLPGDVIEDLLTHPNPVIRRLLAASPHPLTVDGMASLVSDRDVRVRLAAVESGRPLPAAWSPLDDNDATVRAAAARLHPAALCREDVLHALIQNERYAPVLTALISSPDAVPDDVIDMLTRPFWTEPAHQAAYARRQILWLDPRTRAYRLTWLRRAIVTCGRPLSGDTVHRLATGDDRDVRHELVRSAHPLTTEDVLWLVPRSPTRTLRALYARVGAPPMKRDWPAAARAGAPLLTRAVMAAATGDQRLVARFAADPSPLVRYAVTLSRKASDVTLTALADDPSPLVRRGVQDRLITAALT